MFHDRKGRSGVAMSNEWLVDGKTTPEALEICFCGLRIFPLILSQKIIKKSGGLPTTSRRGDAPRRMCDWDGSQAGPDVESPQWLKPPLSSCLSALDKDRPLGPLDHLVTVVMRKAPRGRYIGSRDIFIHNRATNKYIKIALCLTRPC